MIKKFKYLFWIGIIIPTLLVITSVFILTTNKNVHFWYYLIFIFNYILVICYLCYFFILMQNNSDFLNELVGIHFQEIFSESNLGLVVYDSNNNIIWINQYLLNNNFKKYIGKSVNRIHSKINKLLNNHDGEEKITLNNVVFSVKNHFLNNTLIFKNVTKYEVLKKNVCWRRKSYWIS